MGTGFGRPVVPLVKSTIASSSPSPVRRPGDAGGRPGENDRVRPEDVGESFGVVAHRSRQPGCNAATSTSWRSSLTVSNGFICALAAPTMRGGQGHRGATDAAPIDQRHPSPGPHAGGRRASTAHAPTSSCSRRKVHSVPSSRTSARRSGSSRAGSSRIDRDVVAHDPRRRPPFGRCGHDQPVPRPMPAVLSVAADTPSSRHAA